jgi:sensor histidine kinase YesM
MPNDMCTILANLLDNAIEATEKVDGDKVISLTIRRVNHFVVIKIVFPVLRGVLSLLFPIIAMGIVLFLLSALAFVFKNSVTYSKKFKDFISDLLGDTNNSDDKKQ